MKKTFKLLISVFVVLAVILVPMTVSAEDTLNYFENTTDALVVGENDYPLSDSYEYTVFNFTPDEVGKYTITSDYLIGFAGYHWPEDYRINADNVNLNSYEWECNSVGQGIYIAVKGNQNSATAKISVKLVGVEVEKPITREPYEITANVETFTFDGDTDALEFVDAFDDKVDEAILGADGYYHLNSATGPILYMNLYDTEFIQFMDSVSYGQLVAAVFENGEHVATIDYNDAFTTYYNAADAETGLYPLNADLIEIYQKVGSDTNHNWYGESGWITGSNIADGWLFAAMYIPSNDEGNDVGNQDNTVNNNIGNTTGNGSSTSDDISDTNSTSGTTNADNNANTSNGTTNADNNANTSNGTTNADKGNTSPKTSDSLATITFALVSASVLVITSKKKF